MTCLDSCRESRSAPVESALWNEAGVGTGNPRWAVAFATLIGLLSVIVRASLWSLDRGVALERAIRAEADAAKSLRITYIRSHA